MPVGKWLPEETLYFSCIWRGSCWKLVMLVLWRKLCSYTSNLSPISSRLDLNKHRTNFSKACGPFFIRSRQSFWFCSNGTAGACTENIKDIFEIRTIIHRYQGTVEGSPKQKRRTSCTLMYCMEIVLKTPSARRWVWSGSGVNFSQSITRFFRMQSLWICSIFSSVSLMSNLFQLSSVSSVMKDQ